MPDGVEGEESFLMQGESAILGASTASCSILDEALDHGSVAFEGHDGELELRRPKKRTLDLYLGV